MANANHTIVRAGTGMSRAHATAIERLADDIFLHLRQLFCASPLFVTLLATILRRLSLHETLSGLQIQLFNHGLGLIYNHSLAKTRKCHDAEVFGYATNSNRNLHRLRSTASSLFIAFKYQRCPSVTAPPRLPTQRCCLSRCCYFQLRAWPPLRVPDATRLFWIRRLSLMFGSL